MFDLYMFKIAKVAFFVAGPAQSKTFQALRPGSVAKILCKEFFMQGILKRNDSYNSIYYNIQCRKMSINQTRLLLVGDFY